MAPPAQPRTAPATSQAAAPPSAQAQALAPNDPNVRVTASSINGGLPPAGSQPQPAQANLPPAAQPQPNAPLQANLPPGANGPQGANVPAVHVPPASSVPMPPGLNVPPGATGPTASSALAGPAGGAGGATPNGAPPAANTVPNGQPQPTSSAATVSTQPVASCDSSGNFPIYTIQPGDTLSGVAAKFGLQNGDVPGWKLIVDSNKPDLVDEDDLLQIDQKLLIPMQGCKNPLPSPPAAASTSPAAPTPAAGASQAATAGPTPAAVQPAASTVSATGRSGVVHTVVSRQTLGDIAAMYDVQTADVALANKDKLPDVNKLEIGQQLFIPNPKKSAPPAAQIIAPQSSSSSSAAASAGGTGGSTSASSSSQQTLSTGASSSAGFSWPTGVRTVSSYFSGSHPLGIDIDLYSQPNGAIAATAAGTVTFAGGNSCCSYGLYVTIDHGNGLSTLYAHLSKINVTTGQKVTKGQVLGNGGRTGYATGNHLHLEVRKDGKVVNPLSYLP